MAKHKKSKAPQQQNIGSSSSTKLTEEEMEKLKRVFMKAHKDIKEHVRKKKLVR